MNLIIKEVFKDDYISRVAGEKLRKLIIASIKKKEILSLDFSDLTIASTSFFDEGIAKLVNEKISVDEFMKFVVIKSLDKNDQKVMDRVTEYRGFKLGKK